MIVLRMRAVGCCSWLLLGEERGAGAERRRLWDGPDIVLSKVKSNARWSSWTRGKSENADENYLE
jgi:hypothetical protein